MFCAVAQKNANEKGSKYEFEKLFVEKCSVLSSDFFRIIKNMVLFEERIFSKQKMLGACTETTTYAQNVTNATRTFH